MILAAEPTMLVAALITLSAALVGILVFRALYTAKPKALGKLYDVNRIQQHVLECGTSHGTSTVVFESGSNYGLLVWGTIFEELSKQTAVVATERPGLGFSELSKKKRTLDDVADNLHEVLSAAGVLERPLVLVGWSNGCMYLRRMLERHPSVKERVKGIVFIDSFHECAGLRLKPAGIGRELVNKKHEGLQKIAWLANLCIYTGIANVLLACKSESAKRTNFVTALLSEVSNSLCG